MFAGCYQTVRALFSFFVTFPALKSLAHHGVSFLCAEKRCAADVKLGCLGFFFSRVSVHRADGGQLFNSPPLPLSLVQRHRDEGDWAYWIARSGVLIALHACSDAVCRRCLSLVFCEGRCILPSTRRLLVFPVRGARS